MLARDVLSGCVPRTIAKRMLRRHSNALIRRAGSIFSGIPFTLATLCGCPMKTKQQIKNLLEAFSYHEVKLSTTSKGRNIMELSNR